jgi:hypothetical protein
LKSYLTVIKKELFMSDNLEFIKNLGFKEEVGEWKRDKGKKWKISFSDNRNQTEQKQKEWVYAFIVNNGVMYIGQTDRTLEERMRDYRDRRGNGTTTRISENIEGVLLKKNGKVLVYAISLNEIEPKKINIGGEEITLTTDAFEKIAIGAVKPEWNRDGKEKQNLPENNETPRRKQRGI